MAKKPSQPVEEAETSPAAAGSEAAKAREPKKGKDPKASKEPKGKAKEVKAKTAPAVPATESSAAAAAPPAPASAVTPSAPSADDRAAPKKKGRRPGYGPRRGKKLRDLLRGQQEKLRKEGPLPLTHAIGALKHMKRSKFDETVEIHMALGVDTSQNDQLVRGSVPLPHGIGKSVRVLVFCQGDNVAKAKEAGADYAGSDEFIKKIQQEGWLDFDVALATQDLMGQVSRLGKVLGPRGLMPTPKSGTVVTAGADVAVAVKEFKAGKVEYRTDKGGNIHAGIGKISFEEKKLAENITAFVEQVRAAKPTGVKGNFVKSITLSATMSPGIAVNV
jgi:large subunit ribosomal protein L1